jgi:hypothetical protein
MQRTPIATSGFAVAIALALAGCQSDRGGTTQAQAQAQGATLGAQLTGAQEVPPTTATGRGDATVSVDRNTKTAKWRVSYSGLSGPATMAHFHGPAAPGSNAPPVIWLSPQGQAVPNPIEGQQTLTDQQMADLLAGRYYVNIHTAGSPGGEIRGQVTPR